MLNTPLCVHVCLRSRSILSGGTDLKAYVTGTELLYVYVVWLWRKSGVYTLHVSGGTDLKAYVTGTELIQSHVE